MKIVQTGQSVRMEGVWDREHRVGDAVNVIFYPDPDDLSVVFSARCVIVRVGPEGLDFKVLEVHRGRDQETHQDL